jgi:hypothetical protein
MREVSQIFPFLHFFSPSFLPSFPTHFCLGKKTPWARAVPASYCRNRMHNLNDRNVYQICRPYMLQPYRYCNIIEWSSTLLHQTPKTRFPPCHTAKLTAVIGTTFKYPILNPTKNPFHPPECQTAPTVSPQRSHRSGHVRPPTCILRRTTSKGYDMVWAIAPETAPMARSAMGVGLA